MDRATTIETTTGCDWRHYPADGSGGWMGCGLVATHTCNGAFACERHAHLLTKAEPLEPAVALDLVNRRRMWPSRIGGVA